MNTDDKMKAIDGKFDEILDDLNDLWPMAERMAKRAFHWGLFLGLAAGFVLGWLWT